MQDTLEILSTVFGVLSFIEIIKGFIAKHRVGNYNSAGSKSVKDVKSVTRLDDAHSVPVHGEPNSVTQSYKNGNLVTERYYDNNGNPYLDIDYTDHGNPKMHSVVPHEHSVDVTDGAINRERKGRAINR